MIAVAERALTPHLSHRTITAWRRALHDHRGLRACGPSSRGVSFRMAEYHPSRRRYRSASTMPASNSPRRRITPRCAAGLLELVEPGPVSGSVTAPNAQERDAQPHAARHRRHRYVVREDLRRLHIRHPANYAALGVSAQRSRRWLRDPARRRPARSPPRSGLQSDIRTDRLMESRGVRSHGAARQSGPRRSRLRFPPDGQSARRAPTCSTGVCRRAMKLALSPS